MADEIHHLEDDPAADARLRALFQGASRPPMADERFPRTVMAAVEKRDSRARQWRLAGLAGLGSVAAALLLPHLGSGATDIWASLQMAGDQIPFVGASGAAVIAMALVCAAGWAVAERA